MWCTTTPHTNHHEGGVPGEREGGGEGVHQVAFKAMVLDLLPHIMMDRGALLSVPY